MPKVANLRLLSLITKVTVPALLQTISHGPTSKRNPKQHEYCTTQHKVHAQTVPSTSYLQISPPVLYVQARGVVIAVRSVVLPEAGFNGRPQQNA